MKQIIYVDFDGVLVNTTKYIEKEIMYNGYSIDTFKNICWNKILKKCKELNNNIKYINKLSKYEKIVILTHVYSKYEESEKTKYIKKRMKDVGIIAVPYFIKKSDAVNAYNNILIDDFDSNIISWNKKGGIGIHSKKNNSIRNLLTDYTKIIKE